MWCKTFSLFFILAFCGYASSQSGDLLSLFGTAINNDPKLMDEFVKLLADVLNATKQDHDSLTKILNLLAEVNPNFTKTWNGLNDLANMSVIQIIEVLNSNQSDVFLGQISSIMTPFQNMTIRTAFETLFNNLTKEQIAGIEKFLNLNATLSQEVNILKSNRTAIQRVVDSFALNFPILSTRFGDFLRMLNQSDLDARISNITNLEAFWKMNSLDLLGNLLVGDFPGLLGKILNATGPVTIADVTRIFNYSSPILNYYLNVNTSVMSVWMALSSNQSVYQKILDLLIPLTPIATQTIKQVVAPVNRSQHPEIEVADPFLNMTVVEVIASLLATPDVILNKTKDNQMWKMRTDAFISLCTKNFNQTTVSFIMHRISQEVNTSATLFEALQTITLRKSYASLFPYLGNSLGDNLRNPELYLSDPKLRDYWMDYLSPVVNFKASIQGMIDRLAANATMANISAYLIPGLTMPLRRVFNIYFHYVAPTTTSMSTIPNTVTTQSTITTLISATTTSTAVSASSTSTTASNASVNNSATASMASTTVSTAVSPSSTSTTVSNASDINSAAASITTVSTTVTTGEYSGTVVPKGVSYYQLSDSKIRVSWIKATHPLIVGYSINANGTFTCGNVDSCVVNGLHPCSSFNLTVQSIFKNGTLGLSSEPALEVRLKSTAPPPPTSISIAQIRESKSIEFNITGDVYNSCGQILFYVQLFTHTSGVVKSVETKIVNAQNNVTGNFTGLNNRWKYLVKVSAGYNKAPARSDVITSDTITIKPPANTPIPSAPTNFSVSSIMAVSASFTWTASSITSPDTIKSYTIVAQAKEGFVDSKTISGDLTKYVMTLRSCTDYTVSMYSISSEKIPSDSSNSIRVLTPASIISPTKFLVYQNPKLNLTFDLYLTVKTSRCPTTYMYDVFEVTANSTFLLFNKNSPTELLQLTDSSLTPNSSYFIRITIKSNIDNVTSVPLNSSIVKLTGISKPTEIVPVAQVNISAKLLNPDGSLMEYKSELADPTNNATKTLANQTCDNLDNGVKNTDSNSTLIMTNCSVVFSAGSVVADATLTLASVGPESASDDSNNVRKAFLSSLENSPNGNGFDVTSIVITVDTLFTNTTNATTGNSGVATQMMHPVALLTHIIMLITFLFA